MIKLTPEQRQLRNSLHEFRILCERINLCLSYANDPDALDGRFSIFIFEATRQKLITFAMLCDLFIEVP